MAFCYVHIREKEDRTREQNKNNYKAQGKKAIRTKKEEKENIVKNWKELPFGVGRHLKIHLHKVFNRRLRKNEFQSSMRKNEFQSSTRKCWIHCNKMSHISENPDCWKFRLCKKEAKCKKKEQPLPFFSISASKWKSLFWTAIYNMEMGRNNSPLVSKSFVLETDFYFLFRKNLLLILFST